MTWKFNLEVYAVNTHMVIQGRNKDAPLRHVYTKKILETT